MNLLIRKPSAWLPVILSVVVIIMWAIAFATTGSPTRQSDEGTGAHLFQIWLVLELVLILFFTIKWLPLEPKATLQILVLQIITALVATAPVYIFKL